MKATTITAVALIALGVFAVYKPSLHSPVGVPVINAPSISLQVMVKPITEVLDGYSEQAKTLAEFYFEASEIIRRDGKGEKIIQTKSHFRTFCERSTTLRFQGLFKKVPGLANATHGNDGALSVVLGLESSELDHEKAADALHAIAWACQEAT